jgi:ribosomal protein S27AE
MTDGDGVPDDGSHDSRASPRSEWRLGASEIAGGMKRLFRRATHSAREVAKTAEPKVLDSVLWVQSKSVVVVNGVRWVRSTSSDARVWVSTKGDKVETVRIECPDCGEVNEIGRAAWVTPAAGLGGVAIGTAIGAAKGATIGLALGPGGAIAGTIPGALIGAVIACLGLNKAADLVMSQWECGKCKKLHSI